MVLKGKNFDWWAMIYKTIDLCAGIGGIRKGFELTGKFENVLSAEIDPYACKTYEHLYGENPMNDLTSEDFKQKVVNTDYDVLLAGFPCQTFSSVGKRLGFRDKTRGTIFFDIADIISRTTPRAIFLETDMILKNPYHQLQKEYEILPWYKIKRADLNSLHWLKKHPEKVSKTKTGVTVENALAVKKYVTYDTKENRLTKYMMLQTAHRLEQFKNQYFMIARETDQEVIRCIDSMINGIQRRCNTGFMKDVSAVPGESGMSLVFDMAPGYRELYRCYLLLQHGLTVTGSIFNISVKDLAVLYEYWCFIKLNSLMKDKYQLVSQDIIRVDGTGLKVTLVKGQRSQVKYRNPKNGEMITLSYNPKEINVPTVTQRPDNVLKLEKRGTQTEYEYIFDAKYRINPALPNTDYYTSISRHPGPEISDINTMHRYRDAIVYQNGASPYERTMFGAYVLFPYQNEKEYSEHRFYKSIDQVNIGGLPFLPTATSLVTKMLDELISDSSDSAFERATLPRGIESKLAKVDWSKRDVLVGTLKNPEQLDICLKHKFYHIPESRIDEEHLPIHYVAIYQTKAMFGADAKIELYGEVKSTKIVKRKEITEIPSDSDELYYRFEIKSWKKLDTPIKPKEQGFVSIFTNMFLLRHSAKVLELCLQSEEEYRFYTELKRRTDAAVINDEDPSVGFQLGDLKVAFEEGEIILIKEGSIIEKCSVSEFSRTPNATFRRLMNSAISNN